MTEPEDRTGLCTVRELIALMSEQGQDRGEMMVPVAGEHWHFVFTVVRKGAAPVPLPGSLEGRIAAAERRIAELEGRMPLGPIGSLYAKPNDPGWIWPDPPPGWWVPGPWTLPVESVPGAVIRGDQRELPREADLPRWPDRAGGPSKDNDELSGNAGGHRPPIPSKRWLGTV